MENKKNQDTKENQHITMGSELSKKYYPELKLENHSEYFKNTANKDMDLAIEEILDFVEFLDKED